MHQPIDAPSRPLGIDVSAYQKAIDWQKVHDAGISFTYVKGSEDESASKYAALATKQLEGARAAGLLVGLYHFARPDDRRGEVEEDAEREADTFVAVVEALSKPGDLLPTLDLELKAASVDGDELARWTVAFVNSVRARLQRPVRLYTGKWFWAAIGTRLDGHAALDDCPLWLAAYWRTLDPQTSTPASFGPWSHVGMWQYAGDPDANPYATCPGVAGACDRNVYLGTIEELRIEANL